ncbi:BMP family lipoprotein [Ilumatobacter nonamiensis]|uniref:BMP family lipoprotein n=1 Tax=Ilumatobacter nonamiensis TaxID=467093 RepID=UPI000A2EF94B|nr:BMP family ABC transporter substrate-binding protein [Ilumatobacter nonamiensis]
MKKSSKVLAVGMVAALGLAACGSDDDGGDETETTEAAGEETESTEAMEEETESTEAMEDEGEEAATTEAAEGDESGETASGDICEVTDVGGVDDKGFNQIAFEGAQQAAADLGVEAKVLESASDADYATNIQSFIEQDCALIVTVGFLLGDATAEAATNNPDQQFAIIDFGYEEPLDNVLTLNFSMAEPSFVAGYLAAGMTETGTVATYGGINIPPVTVFMDGFVKGVEYYNTEKGTDVTALGWDGSDGTFAGNFENLDDGKNIASSFADEGADVIFPVAGPVGLGSSAYAAENEGIRIIGVDSDLVESNSSESQVYLTSVLKKIDEAVIAAANQVIGEGTPGGEYLGTLENEGTGLAPYHEQEGDVPDELKTEVEDLIAALIAGDVTVDG